MNLSKRQEGNSRRYDACTMFSYPRSEPTSNFRVAYREKGIPVEYLDALGGGG